MGYGQVDGIAKLIPAPPGKTVTLAKLPENFDPEKEKVIYARHEAPEINEREAQEEEVAELLKLAARVEFNAGRQLEQLGHFFLLGLALIDFGRLVAGVDDFFFFGVEVLRQLGQRHRLTRRRRNQLGDAVHLAITHGLWPGGRHRQADSGAAG